jgi:hypothetical protein
MLLRDIIKIQDDFNKLYIHIKDINELRKDVSNDWEIYFKYHNF